MENLTPLPQFEHLQIKCQLMRSANWQKCRSSTSDMRDCWWLRLDQCTYSKLHWYFKVTQDCGIRLPKPSNQQANRQHKLPAEVINKYYKNILIYSTDKPGRGASSDRDAHSFGPDWKKLKHTKFVPHIVPPLSLNS